MMTAAGVRIMTELPTAELKAGRIRIEGNRVYRGQQQVEPRLSFVRADDQPATSAPLRDPVPGIRPQQASGENAEKVDVSYPQFAALPKPRLLPTDDVAADRMRTSAQRQSLEQLYKQRQQAARDVNWPEGRVAPLPRNVLIRTDR